MEKLNLQGRLVGPGEPPYVIAEVGANHNGDLDLARRMIDQAAECGADAVKFQSWTVESIISRAEYKRHKNYDDKKKHFGSLEEMVRAYQLSDDDHRALAEHCRNRNVHFLSTPFSPAEVDLLESVNVPAFKIASMDVNHPVLLQYVASKGRPVILSTGMATLDEVEAAVRVLRESGSGPVALLHCVSIYPPEYSTINLRNIPMMQSAFGVPVGFSDHTIGTSIPLASIALGACVIEKHFTLDKDAEGWDHAISADPDEMTEICREGRNVFESLGESRRVVSEAEYEKRKAFRRCIVLRGAKQKGHVLTIDDLDFKRPGTGIHPNEVPYVVGRPLARDLPDDAELAWSDLS